MASISDLQRQEDRENVCVCVCVCMSKYLNSEAEDKVRNNSMGKSSFNFSVCLEVFNCVIYSIKYFDRCFKKALSERPGPLPSLGVGRYLCSAVAQAGHPSP